MKTEREMTYNILIVEDEESIVDNIKYILEQEGFEVRRTATAGEARKLLEQEKIHLIILDIGLPDMNGMDFYRELHRHNPVPVIFLTARSDEIDRIVGLELGADDYVTKPFSPRELAARVKAVLRRTHTAAATSPATNEQQTIEKKGLFELNHERLEISFKGDKPNLSRYEFELLKALLKHPGRIYSRNQLMERAWDDPAASMERTVDTHIKTIRAKLREIDDTVQPLNTHRGYGYSAAPEFCR